MKSVAFLRSPWRKKDIAPAEPNSCSDDEADISTVSSEALVDFPRYSTGRDAHKSNTPSGSSYSSIGEDPASPTNTIKYHPASLMRSSSKMLNPAPPGLFLDVRAESPAPSTRSLGKRHTHHQDNRLSEPGWDDIATRQRARSFGQRSLRSPSRQSHASSTVVEPVARPPRKSSMAYVPPPPEEKKTRRRGDSKASHLEGGHTRKAEPEPEIPALPKETIRVEHETTSKKSLINRARTVSISSISSKTSKRRSSIPDVPLPSPIEPISVIVYPAPEPSPTALRSTMSNAELRSTSFAEMRLGTSSRGESPIEEESEDDSSDDDGEFNMSMSFLFPTPPPLSPQQLASLPGHSHDDIPELPVLPPNSLYTPTSSVPFKLGPPPKIARRATQPQSILKKPSSSSLRAGRESMPSTPTTPAMPNSPHSSVNSVSSRWPTTESQANESKGPRKSASQHLSLNNHNHSVVRPKLHRNFSSGDLMVAGRSPILVSYPRSPTSGTFYVPPSPRSLVYPTTHSTSSGDMPIAVAL